VRIQIGRGAEAIEANLGSLVGRGGGKEGHNSIGPGNWLVHIRRCQRIGEWIGMGRDQQPGCGLCRRCGLYGRYCTLAIAGRDGRSNTPRSLSSMRASG
jgi:hypothetical protein